MRSLSVGDARGDRREDSAGRGQDVSEGVGDVAQPDHVRRRVPVVTGDVADDEHDPSVGRDQGVVPIASQRDLGVGGSEVGGDLDTGHPRQRGRDRHRLQQPQRRPLDRPILACRSQLPFGGQLFGDVPARGQEAIPELDDLDPPRPFHRPAVGVAIGVLQPLLDQRLAGLDDASEPIEHPAVQPVRVALEHTLADELRSGPSEAVAPVVLHEVHPEVHDAAGLVTDRRADVDVVDHRVQRSTELVTLQPLGRLHSRQRQPDRARRACASSPPPPVPAVRQWSRSRAARPRRRRRR